MYTTGSAIASSIDSNVGTPSWMMTDVTSRPSFTIDILLRCLRLRSRTSSTSRTVMMPMPYVPASAFTMTKGLSSIPYSAYLALMRSRMSATLDARHSVAFALLEVHLAAHAEVRIDEPWVDADERRELVGDRGIRREVMRLLAVVPAGGKRRHDGLVDLREHRRRTRRQVVVQQDHARVEVVQAHAPAVALHGLERERRAVAEVELRHLRDLGIERPDAHAHARLAQDAFERRDVVQVERVARVILGNQQHAARVGAHALDGRLDRLHAQRQERRIEVVEAAGKEIGVDRRELEAGVAQIHRRVERDLVLLPLRAQPALDLGHALEDAPLEVLQRAR